MDLTGKRNYNKKKEPLNLNTMIYGKVPPQAKDMERAILGAIMLEQDAIDTVTEYLKPESFYVNAHQLIYRAILSLNAKNQRIDIELVVEELKKHDNLEIVGGPYYVMQLTNDVVSSANVEPYCKIVKQKFIGRELIRINGETIIKAYDNTQDTFEVLSDHEAQLTALTVGTIGNTYIPIDSAVQETVSMIEALRQQDDVITGIPSGFTELDRLTCGWQKPDLIILAARPAVGKTAFALNLARNAASNNIRPVPVAFFSLEMSAKQLVARIMAAESEITLEKITRGRMSDDDMSLLYSKGVSRLIKMPLYLDDTAGLTVMEFRARARRLKNKHNVQLFFIDYLQLMTGDGKSQVREQEISYISRQLKMIAKELDVTIIALSQLSRAVESRKNEDKTPKLSDLRESGAIEQDADMVLFIYRPEYYDINTNEQGESTRGETHIKIAKNRSGTLETIKLQAQLHIQKFTSWDYTQTPFVDKPALTKDTPWRPTADFDNIETDRYDI